MRMCWGVGVVGLFLAFASSASAQEGTGVVAYFSDQKIACSTQDAMVAEAQKNRSGHGDGLIAADCALLKPHTIALIDMQHPVRVPGCDDVMVYRVYFAQRTKGGKIVKRDAYIELNDLADADVE